MIKVTKNIPTEVRNVAKKINHWAQKQDKIKYNCGIWIGHYKSEWTIASNYEDGFSCLVFRANAWYERTSEGFDTIIESHPEQVIIKIM